MIMRNIPRSKKRGPIEAMQIAVEVPDVVLASGSWTREAIEAEVRREVALALYRSGAVSEGNAAQVAGVNRLAFSQLLGERRVERNYSMDDLRHDLEWAKRRKQPSLSDKSSAPLKDGA
jgi:predicted HTH domain antitoxin